jgi:hypothetical protein
LIDHDSEIVGDDVPVGYPTEDKEKLDMDNGGKLGGGYRDIFHI